MRNSVLCHMRTTNRADQPAHPRSLISAFVVRCLDSITPLVVMHQSFVVPAPGNSKAFNLSVFKALLNALHCGNKFMVKSLLKAPAPPEADNNEEQQMTWIPAWTIWINFLPLSHGGSTRNLASTGPVVSEKILEPTHTKKKKKKKKKISVLARS